MDWYYPNLLDGGWPLLFSSCFGLSLMWLALGLLVEESFLLRYLVLFAEGFVSVGAYLIGFVKVRLYLRSLIPRLNVSN